MIIQTESVESFYSPFHAHACTHEKLLKEKNKIERKAGSSTLSCLLLSFFFLYAQHKIFHNNVAKDFLSAEKFHFMP